MFWLLPLLLSLVSGWFLSRTLTSRAWTSPAGLSWPARGAEAALAILFGPGLASIGFFLLTVANFAGKLSALGTAAALALLSAGVWWKYSQPDPIRVDAQPDRQFPWKWILLGAAVVGSALFLLDFQTASSANPNGEWDATAIWNLRARFLAGGTETWKRAVSAEIGGRMTGSAHPGYPLFLSSFLALQWTAAGNSEVAVPIAASLLFSLGLWILLTTGLASRRSVSLGALAGLVLVASEVFVSQAASQYSDLLLGFAFLAVLMLLDAASEHASRRLWIAAGLAAGFAPWIKNEGLPFTLAALAVVAWKFRRRGLAWTAVGAAPGLLATFILKLISEGRESMFPATLGDAFSKIADVSRWWQILLGFGKAIWDAGTPWAHPVLLLIALGMVLGFRLPAERRARFWLWIPILAALAAEYGLYIVTTADLTWHISTSVGRLLAQLWPSLIWLTLILLKTPEEHFPLSTIPSADPIASGKKKRVRAQSTP